MELNRISDKISFKIISKELETSIQSEKESIDWEEYPRDNEKLKMRYGEFNSTIEKFIRIFKENFTPKQTEKMLYFLSYLNISKRWNKRIKSINHIPLGCYKSEFDWIILEEYPNTEIKKAKEETIMHELLHMASTKNTSHGKITGFELPNGFGKSINELYTVYLTKKYFIGTDDDISKDKSMMMVKGIENIIGTERMQELYFNADLPSLIEELSLYVGRKESIKFIYAMDCLEKSFLFSQKRIDRLIQEIVKINQRKLERDFLSKRITEKQFEEEYKKIVLWFRQEKEKQQGKEYFEDIILNEMYRTKIIKKILKK